MGGGCCIRGVLDAWSVIGSGVAGNRLILAVAGRRNDQDSVERGKTGSNPTDRGKGGVKRSLLTDANGIPLAIVIDGANRHDIKLAKPTLESLVVERPSLLVVWPQGLCLDKGYDHAQT